MSRSYRVWLLLIAIVWQTAAMLSPFSIEKVAANFDHIVLHSHEATHHHHDDQSAHIEDTDEGLQHLHADSGLQTPGLTPTMTSNLSVAQPVSPLVHLLLPRPSPTLDGLLRPPRLVS